VGCNLAEDLLFASVLYRRVGVRVRDPGTAVEHSQHPPARTAGKLSALDQRDIESAEGKIASNPGPDCATADNKNMWCVPHPIALWWAFLILILSVLRPVVFCLRVGVIDWVCIDYATLGVERDFRSLLNLVRD